MSNLLRNPYDLLDTSVYDVDDEGTGNIAEESYFVDKRAAHFKYGNSTSTRIESVLRPATIADGNRYEIYYEVVIPDVMPTSSQCVLLQALQAQDGPPDVDNPTWHLAVSGNTFTLFMKDISDGVTDLAPSGEREYQGAGSNKWSTTFVPGRVYRFTIHMDALRDEADTGLFTLYMNGVEEYTEQTDPILVNVALEPNIKLGLYSSLGDGIRESYVTDYYLRQI